MFLDAKKFPFKTGGEAVGVAQLYVEDAAADEDTAAFVVMWPVASLMAAASIFLWYSAPDTHGIAVKEAYLVPPVMVILTACAGVEVPPASGELYEIFPVSVTHTVLIISKFGRKAL